MCLNEARRPVSILTIDDTHVEDFWSFIHRQTSDTAPIVSTKRSDHPVRRFVQCFYPPVVHILEDVDGNLGSPGWRCPRPTAAILRVLLAAAAAAAGLGKCRDDRVLLVAGSGAGTASLVASALSVHVVQQEIEGGDNQS